MNEYLIPIPQNSPTGCDRIKGAGMSFRPEFYSGRGTYEQDVTANKILIIYTGIKNNEVLSRFPPGASESFLRMVLSMPILSGTAFVTNLLILDEQDYTWSATDSERVASGIALDSDDGTGSREMGAFCTVMSGMSGSDEGDQAASVGMKMDFMRRLNRSKEFIPPRRVHGSIYGCDSNRG